MFDYQTIKLMHPHGDKLFPMEEIEHRGPAAHDPERRWVRGARLFRCTHCPEEVAVPVDPDELGVTEDR